MEVGVGIDYSHGGLALDDTGRVLHPYATDPTKTSTMSCEECVKQPHPSTDINYNDAQHCRELYGLCCGPEPSWYADWDDKKGWLVYYYAALSIWLTAGSGEEFETEPMPVMPSCPAGSMSDPGTECAATGKTACACPTQVQIGRTVAKSACGDPQTLDDYNTCGTARGKTYNSISGKWDVGGTEFSVITGAADTSEVTHFTYDECFGNWVNAQVMYTACAGTRDIPVVFDKCTGTVEVDVQYTMCDGFVTICPETPMSVRFSQAMAYSAAWMSALAFLYNYLGQRELAKRVESLVQDNDLIDKSNDEDAPADDAKGAKTDDVTATVKLRNGSANRV